MELPRLFVKDFRFDRFNNCSFHRNCLKHTSVVFRHLQPFNLFIFVIIQYNLSITLHFFRNISPCFWVCCGVPTGPRQKEKEHTIDSFKKIIDGVHVKALKWLTPHCVGIHKKWRALALLQLLPGRWTADVPLLLITHKHVLWLMNANHRSELIMRKQVHHHNILV